MPRFLYVDPSCLCPTAMPSAPPQHRVGPASQAYCVLPWLMMTSGHLGEPLLFQFSLISDMCSSRVCVQLLLTEDLLAVVVVFLDVKRMCVQGMIILLLIQRQGTLRPLRACAA